VYFQLFHPLNLFWLILVWKKQAEDIQKRSYYTIVPGGLKNEDNPYPVVMSSADTLFDGSIPALKWRRCVEALFEPSARNKIVEIVAKEEAPERALSSYLLTWLEPGDFEEFSSETFYCR